MMARPTQPMPKPPVDTGKLKSTPGWVPKYVASMKYANHINSKVDAIAEIYEDQIIPDAMSLIAQGKLTKSLLDKLEQQIIISAAVPSYVLNGPSMSIDQASDSLKYLASKGNDNPSVIDYADALLTPDLTESEVKKIMQARGVTIPLTETVAHTKPAKPFDDGSWLAKIHQDNIPDSHVTNPETAPLSPPEPTRKRRIILDD